MEYFSQFHWWYVPLGIVLAFIFFGKGKGGIVRKSFTADFQILDDRFKSCRPEADFCIFAEDQPVKLDIDIERLPLDIGEELEFYINGELLAKVPVKKDGRDREAEFEHYSDEGVAFPHIAEGDELVIRYEGVDVIKGRFSESNR